VIALAFAVRAAYILEIRDLPFFAAPAVDAAAYLQQALTVAHGLWLAEDSFWQPPLYPYLLALGIAILGENHLALHLLQALLGAVNCGLIVMLGIRFTSRPAAWLAGAVAAFYGPMIFFDGEYLSTTLETFLNLILLLSLLRAEKTRSAPMALLTGLIFGLSATARPNILAFLPAAAAWLVYCWRGQIQRGRMARLTAVMLAGTVLPIAPVTLHNYLVSHEFVLVSANGGANFYIGNNDNWRATQAIRPSFAWADLMAEPRRQGAEKPGQRSAWFMSKARHDVREHPLAWAGRLAVKTGQFCSGHEYPRNLDLYAYRPCSRILSVLMWERGIAFPFGLISPLALMGMALSLLRRSRGKSLLLLYSLIYAGSVILFFIASRYRIPVIPVLLIFAAELVFWLKEKIQAREYKRTAAALAGIAVLIALCNHDLAAAPKPPPAEFHLFLANSFSEQGKFREALPEYSAALALAPDQPDPYFQFGVLYARMDRPAEARAMFEKSLALAPGPQSMAAAWSHENLGQIADIQGDVETALKEYRASLSAFPLQYGARLKLARLLQKTQHPDEARHELETLIAQYPRRPEPYAELEKIAPSPGD
jgi:Flp pilus assembly protein TadD